MNLELIETDALIEELFSRYDHAIFGGLKMRPGANAECLRNMGAPHMCMGLAHRLIFHSQALLEAVYERTDGDNPN